MLCRQLKRLEWLTETTYPMPKYNYKAKNASGHTVTAVVDAATRLDALVQLRTTGMTVLDLWTDSEPTVHPAGPQPAATTPPPIPRYRFGATIKNTERAVFMRQLSISVGADMPLREALDAIAEDLENPLFRRIVTDVVARLREGYMFSEAAARHPAVFPPLTVALLRVAEEAGSMPQVLDHLATALERSDKLDRKLRGIAAYPVFVAGFFILICSVMTLVVLPKFQENFAGNGNLPMLSRMVFGANRFLVKHILEIGVGLALLVVLFVQYARTPLGRLQLDTLKIKLPIIGPCVQKFTVARFCRNFAIMIRGGVPVATAMEIATGICDNKAMENSLVKTRDRVMGGSTIAAALGMEPYFPRLIVRMVGVGETSGRLPQVLDKVSDTYEDQVESAITMAMALFEPVMICFFGLFVLVLVLAIYLPVFSAARGMH